MKSADAPAIRLHALVAAPFAFWQFNRRDLKELTVLV
jgi:hypothetical protein